MASEAEQYKELPRLHRAAASGKVMALALALVEPAGRAAREEVCGGRGWTPLVWAVHEGRPACVATLLTARAISAPHVDARGSSLLHLAARRGHLACADVLLKSGGAAADNRDASGATPLHEAARGGHRVCVEALLDAGADPTAVSESGATPAEAAAASGHDELAAALRSAARRKGRSANTFEAMLPGGRRVVVDLDEKPRGVLYADGEDREYSYELLDGRLRVRLAASDAALERAAASLSGYVTALASRNRERALREVAADLKENEAKLEEAADAADDVPDGVPAQLAMEMLQLKKRQRSLKQPLVQARVPLRESVRVYTVPREEVAVLGPLVVAWGGALADLPRVPAAAHDRFISLQFGSDDGGGGGGVEFLEEMDLAAVEAAGACLRGDGGPPGEGACSERPGAGLQFAGFKAGPAAEPADVSALKQKAYSSNAGHLDAKVRLSDWLASLETAESAREAAALLASAADQGSGEAAYRLALQFAAGAAAARDMGRARRLLARAAELEHPVAVKLEALVPWIQRHAAAAAPVVAEIAKFYGIKGVVVVDGRASADVGDASVLQLCASLEVLALPKAGLVSVPSEIGQFQSLTKLWLPENQIVSLPAELGQLQALTRLQLTNNKIVSLPAELGQLQALTHLDLNKNQLASLPAELGQLSSLKLLYVSGNRLTALPAELGGIKSLTCLLASHNHLTSIPTELAQPQNLASLYVDNNQLTEVPPEVLALADRPGFDLALYGNPLANP